MNSKLMKAVLAGTAMAAVMLPSTAAQAATTTANANARVLQVVTVTRTSHLEFGTIVPGAAASTVAIAPADGTFSCGAGLTCTLANSRAAFDVGGTTGETVTLASDATVNITSGANSMTVNGLAPNAATMVLTAGTDTFHVGGTLNVGANQAEGNYSGTFNVTVNYQ